MPEFDIAFVKTSHFLPFAHIISVIVFVGFQAHFWLMAKFFIDGSSQKREYELIITMARRLCLVIYLSLFVIAITGALLRVQDVIKIADPMMDTILTTKWALFGFLLTNIVYTTYRFRKALKSIKNAQYIELHENLIVIIYYFIPLNIAFSLLAVYLGVAYGNL
ncbi:MAG: 3-isopropylmalate dehydratase [Campylobacter sp.]